MLWGKGDVGPTEVMRELLGPLVRTFLSERAEIELSGHDLLNQNQGVSITNSSSYIQEKRTESLGRCAMLRLMYRLGRGRGPDGGGGRM
ncbi:MAG: hypothetical protein JSW71_19165 [Gemmatimonadota bacterium]|nr:MAG: hypothetical protein JSW71_19165 [Gemmatimonadota bacterium]